MSAAPRAPSMTHRRAFWRRRIPARAYGQVLRALPVVVAARIVLWVLPLKTALRLTARLRDRARPPRRPPPAQDLARAVRRASRLVPKANCLPQALAGQILLGRAGYETEVRIGIRQTPARGFEAHAWLEHDGRILLGDLPDMAHFTPLPALERYLGHHCPGKTPPQ